MRAVSVVALVALLCALPACGQTPSRPHADVSAQILKAGLGDAHAYALLAELTGGIGARLSGSPQAEAAVAWGEQTMRKLGFQNVHREPVKVPHWVRGTGELAFLITPGESGRQPLAMCALGGSVPTPQEGLEAEVLEVHSLAEAHALGEKAKGKILFYNRPMDATLQNTFMAYGGAVDQRVRGAVEAARVGAIGTLARSMSLAIDDEPHTGMMVYEEGVPRIPSAALSTRSADTLSAALKGHEHCRVHLQLNCQTLPDVESANVVGEIVGTEKPDEVIVMGGHLDSWDLGAGAHDDGAGVTQSLEALRLLKKLDVKPKRTIRVVLFMNEENGARGAKAYAAKARGDSKKQIAAIESDSGGFVPLGFGVSGKANQVARVKAWSYLLEPCGASRISEGGDGTDIEPLAEQGTVLIGLEPDSQRYFDYHHSRKDTLDKVNPRELELGAIAMATLAYTLAEEGI